MFENGNPVEASRGSRLGLAPRMAVDDGGALLGAFLAHRGAALEVDASDVVEIATPCLQVLLSAAASWRADRLAFAVVEPSNAFLVTIGHLGLDLAAFRAEEATAWA